MPSELLKVNRKNEMFSGDQQATCQEFLVKSPRPRGFLPLPIICPEISTCQSFKSDTPRESDPRSLNARGTQFQLKCLHRDNDNQNRNSGHQAPVVVNSTFFPCGQDKCEAKLWAEYATKTKGDVYSRGMFYVGHDSLITLALSSSVIKQLCMCACMSVYGRPPPFSARVKSCLSQTCLPTSPSLTRLFSDTIEVGFPCSQYSTIVRLWMETSRYFMKVFIDDTAAYTLVHHSNTSLTPLDSPLSTPPMVVSVYNTMHIHRFHCKVKLQILQKV